MANQVAKLDAEISVLDLLMKDSEEEIAFATRYRDVMVEAYPASIDEIIGQIAGQTIKSTDGADVFNGTPGNDIMAIPQ